MEPKEFLKTIYLGDRACKSILIDSWGERVLIQVNEISRIRSTSGKWEYYNKENIVDGFLVFTGVDSIKFSPQGVIPNDLINSLKVEPVGIKINEEKRIEKYKFEISISSGDKYKIGYHDVLIEIIADGIHLEDPARPGVKITE